MSRINWKKIADDEFNGMDEEAREQWADLRARAR